MKEDLPLVTIITPAYNRASYLDETILSVLSQDYPRIEYIVLDDGSTDNTREVLEKYKERIFCQWHPNMGETLTVNKGIEMARGEIVCIVNSDDPLLPGAISEAVTLMLERPNVLVAYPDWNEIGPNSEFIKRMELPEYDIFSMLMNFDVSMGPGTFIRKKTFDLVGLRDQQFKYAGDLEFWYRVALHGEMAHIPKALATHRIHPDSASVSDKGAKMAEELIRVIQKVYDHPNVPPKLHRLRGKVFSAAHYVAIFYCGSDRSAVIKHHLWSLLYDPVKYSLRLYLTAISWTYLICHKARSSFLSILSKALRPAWRIVGWPWLKQSRFLGRPSQKSETVKFAFLSHVLPPSWSGQAVVIKRLLRGLDPDTYCLISLQNYKVDKDQTDFIGKLPGTYHHLAPEMPFQRWAQSSKVMWFKTLLATFIRGWRIARILEHQRCTALIAATGDLIDLPAAYLASRFTEISFYPYLFDDYVCQWIDPAKRSIASRLEPIMFSRAAGIIVPNEFLRDEIERRHGVTSTVVRNCCEILEDGTEDIKHSGSKSGEIKIVYTGAVYHVNSGAFRNLITAIEQMGNPLAKLHLYTAQPTEFLKSERVCGRQVVFHQHVPPSEIVKAQNCADILFVPFSFDATVREIVRTSAPGKFGDYLASGTPILAHVPPDSFVGWYLKNYNCGIVVDRDEPAVLASAIRHLIDDVKLQNFLSKNARERARYEFSPKESRRRFIAALSEVQ